MKRFVLSIFLLFFVVESVAAIDWLDFRADFLYARQQPDASVYTAELAYAPVWMFRSWLHFRFEAIVTAFPDLYSGYIFAPSARVNAAVPIWLVILETGPGFQHWFARPAGNFFEWNGKLIIPVRLWRVREFFLGYSKVLGAGVSGVDEFRAGVGVSF